MEKSKYYEYALTFFKAIGGISNQTNVYNCMTRLRFKIVDKKLVNEEEIKKVNIVKNTNWNGDELQIIIGGDCYKVKDQCNIILNEGISLEKAIENFYNQKDNFILEKSELEVKKNNIKFTKKIMPAITAVVFPTIPILIGSGIIGGIQSLLVILHVLQTPAPGGSITDLNLISAIMFVASKVGLELVGVVFLISVVNYLKGDIYLAIFLALGLTSRYLFGNGWELFTLFGQPITIKSYEGTVLPMIAAGFLLHYINKWVKSWMPTQIDVVFRPAIVFFTCFIIMLFTIGPFFRIIEQFISKFVILTGKIPGGIGTGILAMIWQPLVLTGTHVAVVTAITLPMTTTGDPSPMYTAVQIAVMGQIGASIAVAILAKNQKTKIAIMGGIPGAIFGITEPLIYGINLPKIKPFLFGCIGGLFGGLLAGATGVAQFQRTGTGIMSWMGLGTGVSLYMGIISGFVSLSVALIITLMLFKDRIPEYILVKKINKKTFKKNTNKTLSEVVAVLKTNEVIKKYEDLLQGKIKLDSTIETLEENQNQTKFKIKEKANKLHLKGQKEKVEILRIKYNKYLVNKISILINKRNVLILELEKVQERYNLLIKDLTNKIKIEIKNEDILMKYKEALNSIEAYYSN
ncbi:PTS transporter subunit EIIC [Mesoplasma corruscae]|uniref:PTS system, beta-glucoside-specific IIABC component n=1 Tax=Mesoplasma corruscae TaxID=216874 RepID=A0A2S5RE70_9MOLU|nr:PTS transporter subunit EIIC [Mesoplasma corruscae]PPE05639.1 PTS system, beta-glucoside-specific IIABC component [Mesoplasma corruscae]